jgi:hypothetical protein
MSKIETIEEFLARGGKIEKLPYVPIYTEEKVIHSTTREMPNILTLDEGAMYYAEKIKRPTKKKYKLDLSNIDLKKLNPDLVKKLKLGEN